MNLANSVDSTRALKLFWVAFGSPFTNPVLRWATAARLLIMLSSSVLLTGCSITPLLLSPDLPPQLLSLIIYSLPLSFSFSLPLLQSHLSLSSSLPPGSPVAANLYLFIFLSIPPSLSPFWLVNYQSLSTLSGIFCNLPFLEFSAWLFDPVWICALRIAYINMCCRRRTTLSSDLFTRTYSCQTPPAQIH